MIKRVIKFEADDGELYDTEGDAQIANDKHNDLSQISKLLIEEDVPQSLIDTIMDIISDNYTRISDIFHGE